VFLCLLLGLLVMLRPSKRKVPFKLKDGGK
jgi:hypothetical protein